MGMALTYSPLHSDFNIYDGADISLFIFKICKLLPLSFKLNLRLEAWQLENDLGNTLLCQAKLGNLSRTRRRAAYRCINRREERVIQRPIHTHLHTTP
jgi:hypothetical protein